MRWLALPILLAAALLSPLAAAASPPEVRLFLHPAGGTYRVNTQPPRGTFLEHRALTAGIACSGPAPLSGAADYVARSEQVVAVPGPGETWFADEARLQQDVGAAAQGLALHWVMATQASAAGSTLPAAEARVTVEASLRDIAEDRSAAGPHVLAAGSAADVVLARQASSGATWTPVGDLDVYEVSVPLSWSAPPLFPSAGYTLLVRVQTDLGQACPDGMAPPDVVAYADPAHAPFLRVLADTPPHVQGLDLSPGEGGRVLTAAVAGSWGGSDVDAGNATLEVRDAEGRPWPVVLAALQEPWRQVGHSLEPVRFAWAWNATGAPAGRYVATLAVPNLQRTAVGNASLEFEFAPSRPAPAGGALAPFVALAVALLARRCKVVAFKS